MFPYPLRDQQIADLDHAVRLIREHVVDEQDQVGVDLLDLADNRLGRPRRPAPLHSPRVDREVAEPAIERATPRAGDLVDLDPRAHSLARQVVRMAAQLPSRHQVVVQRHVGPRPIEDHLAVAAAVGQTGDLRPRAALGDLGNRLLAIAADHGVHVRTRLQPVTRILRRRPPAQNRHHPRRQGVDVVADQFQVLRPVDGIADQVGLRSEERLRAGRAFMPEVDQIDPLGIRAERGGDVLQPQRREGCP